MNIFYKMGAWWDKREPMRRQHMDLAYETLKLQAEHFNAKIAELKNEMGAIHESQAIPQTIAKEFALIKARLDRLELLTGLKREPTAVHVEDTPRIG